MIKVSDYYKMVIGKQMWIKITNITSEKYFVDYEIFNSNNTVDFGKKTFNKEHLDFWEKTGELQELSNDEIIIFDLVMDKK